MNGEAAADAPAAATSRRTRSGRPLAGRVEAVRTAHPVDVLRWLRAAVLFAVAVSALLYTVVAVGADRQIAAARRTDRAVHDISKAITAAEAADGALSAAFKTGQVELIGTGTDFANSTAGVNTDVTSAAAGNAAGKRGLTEIQYVQGQLTTCVQLADAAVRDYDVIGAAALADAHSALVAPDEYASEAAGSPTVPDTGGLIAALADLKSLEQDALDAQRHSRWLEPSRTWPLLVGPSVVMLGLLLATGSVVARHFRRRLGPYPPIALLLTAGVGVTAGVLGRRDEHRLAADPRAGHPVTLVLALCLLAAAGLLVYLAYRPRLAEYRFPRS